MIAVLVNRFTAHGGKNFLQSAFRTQTQGRYMLQGGRLIFTKGDDFEKF
jgi:hypothetical protein